MLHICVETPFFESNFFEQMSSTKLSHTAPSRRSRTWVQSTLSPICFLIVNIPTNSLLPSSLPHACKTWLSPQVSFRTRKFLHLFSTHSAKQESRMLRNPEPNRCSIPNVHTPFVLELYTTTAHFHLIHVVSCFEFTMTHSNSSPICGDTPSDLCRSKKSWTFLVPIHWTLLSSTWFSLSLNQKRLRLLTLSVSINTHSSLELLVISYWHDRSSTLILLHCSDVMSASFSEKKKKRGLGIDSLVFSRIIRIVLAHRVLCRIPDRRPDRASHCTRRSSTLLTLLRSW